MKSIAPTILKWTNQAATEWSGTGTTSNQVNPLIKMKNIGDYTLGTTEILWTGYTTVRVLATMGDNSIFGKAVNLFSGLPKGFVALLDAAAPQYISCCSCCFVRVFPYQFTYHLYHSFSG